MLRVLALWSGSILLAVAVIGVLPGVASLLIGAIGAVGVGEVVING